MRFFPFVLTCPNFFHFVLCKQTNKWSFRMSGWYLSLHPLQLLSWCPALTPGSVWFTWGQDNLNTSPSTPTWPSVWPFISLLLSLCQSSSETQTAYVHSKDSKLKTDNHPHTPQPQSHTQIQVKKTSCVLTKGCGADSTRDIWYPQSPSCCWWSKELPLIV